jgi:uncharacterized protein YjbI with pentapeptide repeats
VCSCRGTEADPSSEQKWFLAGANLQQANLQDAVLQGAKLGRADLRNTNLRHADLTEADLTMADLRGADLSQTKGLTQAQLDKACTDAATVLPAGLSQPQTPQACER